MLTLGLFLASALASAQNTSVADTLVNFSTTDVIAEPDPNANHYVFSIFDASHTWKVQINYSAPSMYGTFTDADFDLAGSGKNYNYIRPAASDWQFYSFQHLDVTVADRFGATIIDVNGVISDWGTLKRVLVHAELPAANILDTTVIELGVVSEIANSFFEYTLIEGASADYSLTFGIIGMTTLQTGTFYTADMLMPEFYNLQTGDTIRPADATVVITEDEDIYYLEFTLLDTNGHLYIVHMRTGALIVTDTVMIDCYTSRIIDHTDMYGLYQFYGESTDYNVAVSVKPGVIYNSFLTIPSDSIVLTFTTVARRSDLSTVRIASASATLTLLDPNDVRRKRLDADLLGTDGTLYRISMPVGFSYLPEASDTLNIDFGNHIGRVDYTHGMGMVGFVASLPSQYDIHFAFYNGYTFDGVYDSELFDYESCYVTTYKQTGVRFTDIKAAEVNLEQHGDTLYMVLDAVGINDTLYHATMHLDPKLTLGDRTYQVGYNDNAQMIAIREATEGNQALYRLQFQHAQDWTADGEPIGDAEIFDFRFIQTGWDGIQGTYGYSEGTLDMNAYHTIYEGGTEIYLAPVAGTLTFIAGRWETLTLGDQTYRSHWYTVSSQFVAENGATYTLEGQNVLVCIDGQTEEWLSLTESEWTAIQDLVPSLGTVRKIYRNGQILIQTDEATYDLRGQRVE